MDAAPARLPAARPSWPVPRPLVALPWGAVAGLLLAWNLAPGWLSQYAFVPLLLSVVLFGLPHGALDHLVPGRLGWGRRPLPVLLSYLIGLLGLVALARRTGGQG
ncbi:hypothetical protein DAERI_070038 [Deinococcus aerius]|uniref:Beta-carotene 15,15'-dioxygenase n=1 Tax=Deinococcus aerius TaxID=200253 RepID=A0A2I9D6H9_9DEIO|nr:hypothetical protein DAERI_070038 [Deinococcus aerius]